MHIKTPEISFTNLQIVGVNVENNNNIGVASSFPKNKDIYWAFLCSLEVLRWILNINDNTDVNSEI